jgi:hypothetical protein
VTIAASGPAILRTAADIPFKEDAHGEAGRGLGRAVVVAVVCIVFGLGGVVGESFAQSDMRTTR